MTKMLAVIVSDCCFVHKLFSPKTAENYLSEVEGETTDVESVVTEKSNTESELSSNYGKLKHSDSLLLLTQVSLGVFCVAEISPNFTNYPPQNLVSFS